MLLVSDGERRGGGGAAAVRHAWLACQWIRTWIVNYKVIECSHLGVDQLLTTTLFCRPVVSWVNAFSLCISCRPSASPRAIPPGLDKSPWRHLYLHIQYNVCIWSHYRTHLFCTTMPTLSQPETETESCISNRAFMTPSVAVFPVICKALKVLTEKNTKTVLWHIREAGGGGGWLLSLDESLSHLPLLYKTAVYMQC